MSTIPQYQDFESAYLDQLERVYKQPQFTNAPRGNPSREILSLAYRIEDPRDRTVRRASRRTNLIFQFAEVLWYLSGSAELSMIAFYAPSMTRYSADQYRLQGTAYGPRIFQFGGAGIDQWSTIVRTLADDPDSKRAFVQIFAPEELLISGNIDVACTIGLQYFARDGALHAASFMRANDAYRGAVSDVFSFTFLQELLAAELGQELGSYSHFVGSYHIYDVDLPNVVRTLEQTKSVGGSGLFPRMPRGNNWKFVREVLALERACRTGSITMDRGELERLDLPDYWRDIVCLFALHAKRRGAGIIDRDLLGALPALYRALVENCWRIDATPEGAAA